MPKKKASEVNENMSSATFEEIESSEPGCGKEFNRSVCLAKHFAARKRESQGLRLSYEPCAYCPMVLKLIELEKSQKKEEK